MCVYYTEYFERSTVVFGFFKGLLTQSFPLPVAKRTVFQTRFETEYVRYVFEFHFSFCACVLVQYSVSAYAEIRFETEYIGVLP